MMNQKTAVVSTILAVLSDRGVSYELNGPTPVSEVLTDADYAIIKQTLVNGFKENKIEMSEEARGKYSDEAKLKSYVSGLVSNWVRKEKSFNCGSKYEIKNPGSRAGQGDEQIKEMKALLSVTTDPAHKALIQSAIDARIAEIKPSQAVEIDVSKLPESLRHLVK